jgi:DNA recombination protein RmuC
VILIASVLFFLTGFGLSWAVLTGRRAALDERLRATAAEAARLASELAAERAAKAELAAAHSKTSAELAAERASAEARLGELRSAHERLRGEFSELSQAALRANRDDFMKLAQQTFGELHGKSAQDLESRKVAIDALVKPLKESLDKLEERRERAYGDLGRQLETLNTAQIRMQTETTKLSTALSSTRTSGTWGEVQLRRVVELAGMMDHCDFAEQEVVEGGGRPDLIVSLPGGQRVVVDAKAPTEAFREAAAEADPEKRQIKLREHAQKVRGHVEALASREYWAKLEHSPEYVVLFLPGDSFLSAAIESDPSIMDRAIERRVLLATPMTLVALLKAAYYGWNQEKLSRNAEDLSRTGRELYNRIATFSEHLSASAKGLSSAVKNFNAAIGSFDQSVMPGARKFEELGAKGTKDLEGPEPIELEVREPIKRS